MNTIRHSDESMLLYIEFPDALPSVRPIHYDVAYQELAAAAAEGFRKLKANFDEHGKDPHKKTQYVLRKRLRRPKGELMIAVVPPYTVTTRIAKDWLRELVYEPLMQYLFPSNETIACFEAKLIELASREFAASDPLDEKTLDAVHSLLWSGADEIDFDFTLPEERLPGEPEETTHEHVLPSEEAGIHEEIVSRLDDAAGLLYDTEPVGDPYAQLLSTVDLGEEETDEESEPAKVLAHAA